MSLHYPFSRADAIYTFLSCSRADEVIVWTNVEHDQP
jgi:hypothetical protein